MAIYKLLPDTLEKDERCVLPRLGQMQAAQLIFLDVPLLCYVILPHHLPCSNTRKWLLSEPFSVLMVFYLLLKRRNASVCGKYIWLLRSTANPEADPFSYLLNLTHVPMPKLHPQSALYFQSNLFLMQKLHIFVKYSTLRVTYCFHLQASAKLSIAGSPKLSSKPLFWASRKQDDR